MSLTLSPPSIVFSSGLLCFSLQLIMIPGMDLLGQARELDTHNDIVGTSAGMQTQMAHESGCSSQM